MDQNRKEEIETEINALAKSFSMYKNDSSNRGLAMAQKAKLTNFFMNENEEYGRYLKEKAKKDFAIHGIYNSISDSDMLITDTLMKTLDKYDHMENDSFAAFFFTYYNYGLKDLEKKQKNEYNRRASNTNYSTDKSEESASENEKSLESGNEKELRYNEEQIEIKVFYQEKCMDILSMITRFYEHNKGKEANEKRYYYSTLFTTDKSVALLKAYPLVAKQINENEYFSTVNKKFLDYFMNDKCSGINEVIFCRLKKYAQIAEHYLPDEAETEAEQPLKPAVYIKYIFQDKGEKISDSAFSQQKKAYDTKLRTILNEN